MTRERNLIRAARDEKRRRGDGEDTATGGGASTAINGTTASQRFITAISFINYPRRWLGGGGDVSLFMQIGRQGRAEAGCARTGGSLFIVARRVASGKE